MKIKLINIMEINSIFSKYYNSKLPIKTSFKIMKFSQSVEKEVEFFKNKLAEIVDQTAEKDADGRLKQINGEYILIPEKIDDFNQQYNELQEIEVEIEDLKFSLNELESLELTPQELYTIQDFIEE